MTAWRTFLIRRPCSEKPRGLDDGLVADVERAQPGARGDRGEALAGADHADAQARVLGQCAGLREQAGDLRGRPQRVARDQQHAALDSVGEHGTAVGGEQVVQVAAQLEEAQRARAVLADHGRDLVLTGIALGGGGPPEGDPQQQPERGGAQRLLGAERDAGQRQRGAAGQRGGDDHGGVAHRVHGAGGVVADPEGRAPADQHRRDRPRDDRLLDVEALGQVDDADGGEQDHRRPQRAAPAQREVGGHQQQGDAEGQREAVGGHDLRGGRERVELAETVGELRRQRRGHVDQARERGQRGGQRREEGRGPALTQRGVAARKGGGWRRGT